MTTITTINATDVASNSRTVINTNFSNLNTDKIETSVLDTDNTLAANDDSKIPSQKAVKAYVDAGGNVNASETTKGIVEEATDAEVTAGTATGATGAKLIVTPAKLATRLTAAYQPLVVYKNGTTTYTTSTASGTQTIAHGLGVIPKYVKITATSVIDSTSGLSWAQTIYNGTTQSSNGWLFISGSQYTLYTTFRLDGNGGGSHADGVITFDATNITITWTKTGTPTAVANLMWEAHS